MEFFPYGKQNGGNYHKSEQYQQGSFEEFIVKSVEHSKNIIEQGTGFEKFMNSVAASVFEKNMIQCSRIQTAVKNSADCHRNDIVYALADMMFFP